MIISRGALLLFAAVGCLGVPQEANSQSHSHAHHHAGTTLDVKLGEAPKIVEIKVLKDASSGFNLLIRTENFTFAPELVNTAHSPGKGHAHIYVDGVKLGRLYGTAFHLEKLAPGKRQIEVTLNANDHREYAVGGKKISASTVITVQ